MLLWIFFIITSFLLGLSVSLLLSYTFQAIERFFFSIVVGHAIALWITFLLACLSGSLSSGVILMSIVICIVLSVILWRIAQLSVKDAFSHVKSAGTTRWHEDIAPLAFLMIILLYVVFMNLYGVFRPDDAGNIYAFHTVWADYPFHTSVITSLAYRTHFSFPLSYPQFLHTDMHYPVIMDFFSAVLMKGGLDLRNSLLIPNILLQLSFFVLFFYLAYRVTGWKNAGILATFIFIFSGFPYGLQSTHLHFLNPMYAVIMPQRTAMFGLGISCVVYLLLFYALCTNEQSTPRYRELILTGALIGMLPNIHAHSFIVTAFVSLFLVSFAVIKKKDVKIAIFLFVPLLLLSFPQILWIRSGVSEEFFVFFPGWTEENMSLIMGYNWSSIAAAFSSTIKSISILHTFWALNAGGLVVLLSLGLLKADTKARIFYLPFLLLFFIANLVKFQPWYFDNYKLFIHWLLLTAVMATVAIRWRTEFTKRTYKSIATVSLVFLIIASTVFGIIAQGAMVENTHVVWTNEETEIAELVRVNTPPDSLFLTGSAHNHPIPALSGRHRVMGYEGWLWSHGINWTQINDRKRDEREMYNGNYTLIKEYGVGYICLGPYERIFAVNNHFTINYSAFDDETRYYLAYDEQIDGERWRIYGVKIREG